MNLNKIDLVMMIFEIIKNDPAITLGAISPSPQDKASALIDIGKAVEKYLTEKELVENLSTATFTFVNWRLKHFTQGRNPHARRSQNFVRQSRRKSPTFARSRLSPQR